MPKREDVNNRDNPDMTEIAQPPEWSGDIMARCVPAPDRPEWP